MQKKTAAFRHALSVLKGLVPQETYDAEVPTLLEQFLAGHLDLELRDVVAEQREEWGLEGLSTFKHVVQRHDARNAGEARKRQSERAAKAAAANYDMLAADLQEDSEEVDRYHDLMSRNRRETDRRVCKYRRDRYERGTQAVEDFMGKRCQVIDLGPSPKRCSKVLAEARRKFEADDAAGSSLVLIYVDLNIDHCAAALTLVTEALKLIHLSPDFGLVVRWMVRHANTSTEFIRKLNRQVEDLIHTNDIALSDCPATLLFDPALVHKNDCRPLAARFSVGVSTAFRDDSAWMRTPAARGHLGQAVLVRTSEMRQPASKGRGGIGDIKLTPKDRATQLGGPAFKQLLASLPLAALDPEEGGAPPVDKSKCLIVHLEPGEFGEFGHAVLDHILASETSGALPQLAFLGLCREYAVNLPDGSPDLTQDPADGSPLAKNIPLGRVFAGRLREEWWETHPAAGPAEGLSAGSGQAGASVPKPVLRVCSWQGEVPTVLPEAAAKFAAGSDAAEQWQARVTAFEAKHGRVAVATVDEQAGPDYESVGLGRPRDTAALVAVHPRTDEVALAARMHARFAPVEVVLEKDTGDLYMKARDDAPEDEFDVGPCELFGFGLGCFETKTLEEARASALPCLLANDCDLIVRTSDSAPDGAGGDEGKTLLPLASAIFQCERRAGVPEVQVQGHRLAPNGSHFHRYNVHPAGGDVHCLAPREVEAPEATDSGELALTKAGEFGAVLLGMGAPVPRGPEHPCGLAWEMALDRMPPPTLTFSKPKVWLCQRVHIKKANPPNYYKILGKA